jgi:hypothetical protein
MVHPRMWVFGGAVLAVSASRILAQTPIDRGAVSVSATTQQHRMHVPMRVNGRGPYDFLIDRGASGVGRIDRSLVDSLETPVVGSAVNSDGITSRQVSVVRLDSFALASVTLTDAHLLVGNYRWAGQAPPPAARAPVAADHVGFFRHCGYAVQ